MNEEDIYNLINNEVEKSKDEIIQLCQSLIKLKTVSPEGKERKAAELIISKLQDAGVTVIVKDFFNDRGNIIAAFNGTTNSPKLLLNGHLDVVPVPKDEKWKSRIEPFSGTIKRGKIWGRGSVDMKGNVAAMVMAAIILKRLNFDSKLKGSLILNFVSDEEAGGFHGTKRCLDKYTKLLKADATIIGEPTGVVGFPLAIMFGEKGILWLEIKVYGKSAHASVCKLGDNPIPKLWKIIKTIKQDLSYDIKSKYTFKDYKKMLAEGIGEDNVERVLREQEILQVLLKSNTELTSCLTMIKAGEKENQIPESCQAVFDFRLVVEHDANKLLEKIKKIIENLGFTIRDEASERPKGDVALRIRTLDPASRMDDHQAKIIQIIKKAHKIVFERPSYLLAFPASSDAHYFRNSDQVENHPKPICKKTVLFGAGDATLAHAANECIKINDLINITKTYALIIMEYLL